MCRSKQTKNKKNKDKCANFEGASFNKDRCYATPAFILPSEKVQHSTTQIEYLASTREFIRDHDKKVKEYEEELDDLVSLSLSSTCPSLDPKICTAMSAGRITSNTSRYQPHHSAHRQSPPPHQHSQLPLQHLHPRPRKEVQDQRTKIIQPQLQLNWHRQHPRWRRRDHRVDGKETKEGDQRGWKQP